MECRPDRKNLLIDIKEILQPGEEFSRKVLNAHKRLYKALSEKNAKRAHEEMIKHVREVGDDLIALQKAKGKVIGSNLTSQDDKGFSTRLGYNKFL